MITTWLKHRNEILVLIALSLLIILLRLPSIVQPFNNDSAANAYHARLILQGEPLYSTHHPAHHLPAVYYIYAALFWLFGDAMASIKIGLIVWQVVTVWLFYAMAKFVYNDRLAMLATLFYIMLSSDIYLFGMTAEIELFANLPRIASVFLLLYLHRQPAEVWKYSLVGLLGIISFWFKAVYFSTLILFLLIELHNRPFQLRLILVRLGWVMCGVFIGAMPVLGYFAFRGLLPNLGRVFTIGQNYVETGGCVTTAYLTELHPYIWLVYPIIGLSMYNMAVLIFSIWGGTLVITRWRNPILVELRYIAYWFILSYGETLPARAYHPYYFQLLLPAMVILASWFLLDLADLMKRIVSKRVAHGVLIGLSLWAVSITVRHNLNYYTHFTAYAFGQESFETFIRDGFGQPEDKLLELVDLARYIEQHTAPQDKIYYWSNNIQLYYLSHRLAPTQIIWSCYLGAIEPPQQLFIPQTKYIIVDPTYHENELPTWFKEPLNQFYTLETTLHDQKIYRRITP